MTRVPLCELFPMVKVAPALKTELEQMLADKKAESRVFRTFVGGLIPDEENSTGATLAKKYANEMNAFMGNFYIK